jgi:hypothetical protein
MADDSPTLDELRQLIADIESGKLPARRKAALKAKTTGLTHQNQLHRKTPLRRKTALRARRKANGS